MKGKSDPKDIREFIKLFYFSFVNDNLGQLEVYLKHTFIFLDSMQNKFENMEIYSDDFFEYFYAGGYENIFREQFIISLMSRSEYEIKKLLEEFDFIFDTNYLIELSNKNNDIITILKIYSKSHLNINLKLDGNAYRDFHDLQCLRNIIIHSGSKFWLQRPVNIAGVKTLSKRYSNIKVIDEMVWINKEFCIESVEIVRRFFYHICKTTMRNFPG